MIHTLAYVHQACALNALKPTLPEQSPPCKTSLLSISMGNSLWSVGSAVMLDKGRDTYHATPSPQSHHAVRQIM